MIIQKIKFEGDDYRIIESFRDEILQNGESHNFYRYNEREDAESSNPKTIHTAYPHNDDQRYWERTLVTLSLWEHERKGEIAFITQSTEVAQNAIQAVRSIIKEPNRETKSGLELIAELA